MTDQPENVSTQQPVQSPAATPAGPPVRQAAEGPADAGSAKPSLAGLDLVLDVPLQVTVEIGSARMLVQEVLQLDTGSVIELDRMAGEPADMLVNGRVVARGEVIVSDERLAIRLVEITGGDRLGDGHR